jgi:transcriptional regulator with XRE-family HTH domain
MDAENPPIPKISTEYRKKNRWSQLTVIEKAELKIDVNTLSNYENGRTDTPVSILLKLAKLYDCSIDALISRSFLDPMTLMTNFARVDYVIQKGIGKLKATPDQTPYAFDKGIDLETQTYQHFRLLQDDPNIHFPKDTRLIVRMAENIIEIDRVKEQIYLVKDAMEGSGQQEMTTFFTKAGMVKDDDDKAHKSNRIYYTYHGQIQFASLRHFKSIIDGIVVKVFMDALAK